VLDDRRRLCLPNADSLELPATARIVLELTDLAPASPASATSCGVALWFMPRTNLCMQQAAK
jgi:hypothetical protein